MDTNGFDKLVEGLKIETFTYTTHTIELIQPWLVRYKVAGHSLTLPSSLQTRRKEGGWWTHFVRGDQIFFLETPLRWDDDDTILSFEESDLAVRRLREVLDQRLKNNYRIATGHWNEGSQS